jgi:membrane protein DedA with SNARE-associated domain
LILVAGLSIYIFTIRNDAAKLAIYGYPGVFLLAFLSYATIVLPAPGLAVIFTVSGILNPYGVALAAGAGAALGEFSGYLAGYGSQVVLERSPGYKRFEAWMSKNGPLAIVTITAIPNPFFDLAGLTAGALKMPVHQFLLWCWLGETIKMLFFALAGYRFLG